jgi:hypothetical protein
MSRNYCIAIGLIFGSAALIGSAAVAEPLDKQSCTSLQAERNRLLTRDMQAALEQGPDWVKHHLTDLEIDQVHKFLTIEEQIEFRCRGGGVAKIELKPGPKTEAKTDGTGIQSADPGDVPLPDRKPAPPPSTNAQTKASQALADSDKTAPVKAKATR